jgi:AraC-like DNA-binding protein/ABC-type Fe3+-hydroxamate transport system substrate-binding protein
VEPLGAAQAQQQLSLHYIDTQEYKIESQISKQISLDNYCVFGFVVKGSVQVILGRDNDRQMGTVMYGEVFLLPSDCCWTIQNRDRPSSQVVLVRFHCDGTAHPSTSQLATAYAKMNELRLHHFRMPRFRKWIQDLLNPGLQQEASFYFLANSYLYAVTAEFMAFIGKSATAYDNLNDYVVQIRQDMLEHYNAAMDIEEIARLSGSSPARFYQTFKQHTGLSPLKFMTIARLHESLQLLSNDPSSIMDVAHAVGYPDELYFSRLFKKHMGISPTRYAACARKRVANLCPVFRGDLCVLGITPVVELQREWFKDPDKDKYVKQIEQCRPELILTAPVDEDLYSTLSQICPVVMIQWKGFAWKKRLMEISHVLEVPTVAEHWLSYFQMKVVNARAHIQRLLGDKSFLVVSACEPFFRVYGMQRIKMKDLFYDELQMTPPASAHQISFLDVIALDDIAALDCDNILVLLPNSFSNESCIQLEKSWLALKRNRRKKQCIFIRHEEPLLYNASFYEGLIDQLVQYMMTYR